MYADALTVLDSVDQVKNRREEFKSKASEEIIELSNEYLIQNAFDDADVMISYDGGQAVQGEDFTVESLRDGLIEWQRAESDLTIRYKTGPIPNEVVKKEIEAATERIDQRTNTTFGGYETVTHTYDVSMEETRIMLFQRPVESIEEVRLNQAKTGDEDDFAVLEEGRDAHYYKHGDEIVFTSRDGLREGRARVEVTYRYGFDYIPAEVSRLVRMETIQRLMQNSTMGEAIEGRDDFGAQMAGAFINLKNELKNSWTIQRMGEPVPAELQ